MQQRYADEYSEMTPGVRVKVVWVPGDYHTKLNSALLAGEGPDVFEFNGPPVRMVQANQIAPITDLFTAEELADFPQSVMDRVTLDGEVYGVPMIVDVFNILYYRKSALEDAGLEVPATHADLMAAAEELSGGRVKGLFLGNDAGMSYHFANSLVWSDNGQVMADGQVAFNNERTAELWAQHAALAQSDALLVGAPTNWWDPSVINEGLAHIQMGGLWSLPSVVDTWGDDVGVMPWPAFNEDGTPVVIINGWWEFVNADSPNLEEAKKFVQWLWIQNTDAQADWALSYGFHIPPRNSVATEAEVLTEGLAADVVMFVNEYGKDAFPTGWTDDMQIVLQDAFSSVVFKGADIEDAIDHAATTIQSELDALYAE